MWNVLEFGESGREKKGKKEKKRVRVCVWRIKNLGKKNEKNKEIWMKKNKEMREK